MTKEKRVRKYCGPKRKCSYKKSLPRIHYSRFFYNSTRKWRLERTPQEKKYIEYKRTFPYLYKEAIFIDRYLY